MSSTFDHKIKAEVKNQSIYIFQFQKYKKADPLSYVTSFILLLFYLTKPRYVFDFRSLDQSRSKNILQNIPAPVIDPLETLRKLMTNRTCQFKLNTVHPDEVLDIINSLKNSKSCGLDNIDTYVIKLVKHEILPAVTHIVNFSSSL